MLPVTERRERMNRSGCTVSRASRLTVRHSSLSRRTIRGRLLVCRVEPYCAACAEFDDGEPGLAVMALRPEVMPRLSGRPPTAGIGSPVL